MQYTYTPLEFFESPVGVVVIVVSSKPPMRGRPAAGTHA
jgi:hypothetical protein